VREGFLGRSSARDFVRLVLSFLSLSHSLFVELPLSLCHLLLD